MDSPDRAQAAPLSWANVSAGFLFIVFDAGLSGALGLNVGTSLVVAAVRCVLQLAIMSLVLGSVFAARNPWGVVGIALLLNILGATEATYNKAKRRFSNMFPCILVSLLCGSIPISVLGSEFAMARRPFWQPDQYVPIVGLILGNAISAISLAMNLVGREFAENRDKVETRLAFGASRFEAVRPLGVEALKTALLPTINQMSVIGIISIPGMMTGAIVGGESVEQAARLQMIVMFMISASSALCTLAALGFSLSTLIDSQHRIRLDRLDASKPGVYQWRDAVAGRFWSAVRGAIRPGTRRMDPDRGRLLGN